MFYFWILHTRYTYSMEENDHISILSPCVIPIGFDTFNFRGVYHVSGRNLECKHGGPSDTQVSLAIPSGTKMTSISIFPPSRNKHSPLARQNQQFHDVIVTSSELDTRL